MATEMRTVGWGRVLNKSTQENCHKNVTKQQNRRSSRWILRKLTLPIISEKQTKKAPSFGFSKMFLNFFSMQGNLFFSILRLTNNLYLALIWIVFFVLCWYTSSINNKDPISKYNSFHSHALMLVKKCNKTQKFVPTLSILYYHRLPNHNFWENIPYPPLDTPNLKKIDI